MRNLLDLIERVAAFDSTVLITGETGVGKEMIGNVIHSSSSRRHGPFIKINCAAIPENLLEAEFFGYEPGSFTGALRQGKEGIFEAANQGSVFLDEIGDLPFSLQGKLLRVLQEKEVMRIGGTKPRKVDVRVIAATNRDLGEMVARQKFRADLFYRLNVIPVYVPPLRERKEDIPVLIDYFMDYFQRKFGVKKYCSPDVYKILEEYDWPGNVRELRNMVERLFVMTKPGESITAETIRKGGFLIKKSSFAQGQYTVVREVGPLKEVIKEVEEQLIQLSLKKYSTLREAAEALGIDPSTLWRKRKRATKGKR
ncbi:transcriptional regulator [Calderihabitans maritimus]|uniref:Transcriptional regulator n=2 Tax=Calderihabitans maritimus TaxID=1246530 RepID=A0A1Z5HSX3_9FIRM|nr:transcriptional regulator [Calderihabitans maritimus]